MGEAWCTILASIKHFFFKGKKTAPPEELSEVLKVNGSIYIAINSLYKELPLRTVQQLTEAPARARQTGASNKEGQWLIHSNDAT